MQEPIQISTKRTASVETVDAEVWPEGSLEVLSRFEVDQLRSSGEGGLYPLLVRFSSGMSMKKRLKSELAYLTMRVCVNFQWLQFLPALT